MLKSSMQVKMARGRVEELKGKLDQLNGAYSRGETPSNEEFRAKLIAEIGQLEKDIELHDRLQISDDTLLPSESLADLPETLIAARIARGMTQMDLAKFLGYKMQQIQQYEEDRYRATSLWRLITIAEALGVKIHQAGNLMGNRTMGPVDATKTARFPIGEMYTRGWIGPWDGGAIDAAKEAPGRLERFLAKAYGSNPASRNRHVRSKGVPHEGAISAWEARVISLADAGPLETAFDPAKVNPAWVRTMARFSAIRGGVRRIKNHLNDIGIHFIIESPLPGMQIDGGAIRTPAGQMIVALTLRDYRLEWFWLALMYELGHLVLHIAPGEYDGIFDEIAAPAMSAIDEDADVYAREALIPSAQWQSCKSKDAFTHGTILEDAERLRIDPSVVVARARELFPDKRMPSGVIRDRDVRRQLGNDTEG
ncbi:helix-turn-helix domain-containing protein [Sphingobium sp. JS3065]|uniref:XRE family transcriptional regulator n=1 Tax=Sphingobium sp. JS3065 TaxID=2970925 RepID=UPI002263C085|nr:helix-turn-helix transcriptional regulator [Sphingobium sp. JS3065]UZW55658.1 helix-turn-helix domain-containing protein [Sphingobium sp. JS3065]